jgi:uncharacterized membrane protein
MRRARIADETEPTAEVLEAPEAREGPEAPTPEAVVEPRPERRKRRSYEARAIAAIKARHGRSQTVMGVAATLLNDLAGSSGFLVFHAVWFAGWILWNVGALGLEPFDPFPFGLLTMVVSLEAIFLSIFVLMAQKRESAIAELREELALQVNLRVEEEVTKTLQLMSGLYTRLGHAMADDQELGDMLQPLDVTGIELALKGQIDEASTGRGRLARPAKDGKGGGRRGGSRR